MQQKSLFKNTIYKAILSFINILAPVLIGSYIVKLLDIELYGAYNKVYSEFQVFLVFASFGIYTFGVREISKIRNNKEKVSILFSNLFLLSLITNLIVTIIYILYSILTSSGITTTLYLIMIIQYIANIIYVEFVNEALENYKFITLKSVIIKIIYMISLFVFVKNPNDIILYAIIVGLSIFFNNLVSFIYAKKRIGFNFKKIEIKKYIPSLFTILIITNINLLYTQLDKVMLGRIVGNVSVTMYYIPYYLMGTLASIPYAIINVSIPRLSYLLENEGKQAYIKKLNESISSLLFLIIPMCFGVLVLANEAILLYAGSKYMAMVPTLIIACISRIFISIESVMTNLVLYPNNKEKVLLKFLLLCGISNLIMNFLLVYFKVFTPSTALITTTIAEILLIIIELYYSRKELDLYFTFFTKQNILYLVLGISFILIAYLIRLLNLNFWLNMFTIIVTCIVVYGIVLYIKKDSNLIFIKDKLLKKIIKK